MSGNHPQNRRGIRTTTAAFVFQILGVGLGKSKGHGLGKIKGNTRPSEIGIICIILIVFLKKSMGRSHNSIIYISDSWIFFDINLR